MGYNECSKSSVAAREQIRAECAALPRKGYEPPWQTIEVETYEDWLGLAMVRGREYVEHLDKFHQVYCRGHVGI